MTALAQSLLEQVLALPDADRERIADEIRRSLPPVQDGPPDDPAEVEAAWADEIERRVDEMKAGREGWISGDEFLSKLENRRVVP